MNNKEEKIERIVLEAAKRTWVDKNGQDLVENGIDVAFEPLEKAAEFLDNLFGL